jgi:solute carrier family 25 phosphate transporter 3
MKFFLSYYSLLLACLAPSSTNASSTNAGAAALQALKNIDYRYFVAGGTCAAISHGITTPIDVVKTKIQANPTVSEEESMNRSQPTNQSTMSILLFSPPYLLTLTH